MSVNFFWYQRTIVVPVESKNEDGTPGPVENKVVTYDECFNLNEVFRAFYDQMGQFTVMLKDGHEETHEVQIKGSNGRPVSQKERAWYLSEIRLSAKDALRFRNNTDMEYLRTLSTGDVLDDTTSLINKREVVEEV